jgi:predicted neutral ceramidase superfamily lipid hydrolase
MNFGVKIKKILSYIITMEHHWMMVVHSLVIGIVLYALMVFGLGQKTEVAERRSILIAAFALIYMIMFGHGLPVKLNKI